MMPDINNAMPLTGLLAYSPYWFATVVGVAGLIVGSFLNVVIYRLPIMMHRNWRQECLDFLQIEADVTEGQAARFNLAWPGSHCPHCQAAVKPQQNVPILSYVLLRGRCAACNQAISLRYPLVEGFTALLSVIVALHFGYGLPCLFALLLTWSLIAMSFIDIDHHLLPDSISLPLMWAGLLLSLPNVFTNAHDSIIGAAAGYMGLRVFYQLFKWLTGKEGMGYGDFKLLAVLGAWLGWQYLPQIIFLSSMVGAILGIAMVLSGKRDYTTPIPFGPYLAAAGWLALIWGPTINQWYLNLMGF